MTGDGPPLFPVNIVVLLTGLLEVMLETPTGLVVDHVRSTEQVLVPVAIEQVCDEAIRVPVVVIGVSSLTPTKTPPIVGATSIQPRTVSPHAYPENRLFRIVTPFPVQLVFRSSENLIHPSQPPDAAPARPPQGSPLAARAHHARR